MRVTIEDGDDLDLAVTHDLFEGTTGVEARLVAPVTGERNGARVGFVGNKMDFEVRGRLADKPGSEGDSVSVRVRASDTVAATTSPDGSFTLDGLRVSAWPFEIKLTAWSAPRKGR